MTRTFKRRGRQIMTELESDDPLAGVANFFDLGIVFALGFMLAALAFVETKVVPHRDDAVSIEHFRVSEDTVGGKGVQLGMAYRLESGEVVYVPSRGAAGGGK